MSFESGEHAEVNLLGRPPALSVREKRLSEFLWDIDYAASFPLVVNDEGITVELIGAEGALRFTREHYPSLFGDPGESHFWSGDAPELRERYLRHACDIFLFRDGEREVGLFIGNPVDWSTYYIRSTAFLEEYQGRALYERFLSELFGLLRGAGVSRIEAETAPSNLQCMAALVRQRFVASGSILSERWGALTRFTKHLQGEAESAFLRQFCAGGHLHRRMDQRRYAGATGIHTQKGVAQ